MNEQGADCNLLTGEERRETTGVQRWSCTVEMAPLNKPFDVGVIDEIQMIGDKFRGWAWTNAFLGEFLLRVHIYVHMQWILS
jgi:ATP-dependent RNA helicase SUPV3L1/SUV3